MKRKIILFVFILNYLFIINSNKSFSQAFPISEQQSEYFSIDHFANDVYYIHRFTWEIIKRNLHTMESSYTQFSSLPAFGHKSHFAIYFKDDLIYKYDFEKDSTYLLLGMINIKKESMPIVKKIVEMMKQTKDLKLSVAGQTDSRGRNEFNLKLSKARTETVVEAITKGRIDAAKLS